MLNNAIINKSITPLVLMTTLLNINPISNKFQHNYRKMFHLIPNAQAAYLLSGEIKQK